MKNLEQINRPPLTAGSDTRIVQLSLDRLTVVGDFLPSGIRLDGDEYSCPVLDRSKDILRRFVCGFPYHYQYSTVSGVTIQLADKKAPVPRIRLDYNPADPNQLELAHAMLGIMCKKRVTRHDYALDYRMDFSAYIFTTAISTKTCTFSSGTGTRETLYLGAKQAPQRYRIYDKALESKSTGTLWRIEEQMRFKPSDAWQLHLPFANLVTFQTYPTLPVLDRLLLDGLHRNPDEWGALPRRAKERLRSVIKNAPPVAHLNPNPYEAYLALCQEYVDYIHLHTKG